MSDLHLHIVSFDVPWPANYGGVIDVFFKIKALHAAGVKVHLHCFQYRRKPAPELEQFCETIAYYPRKTGFPAALTLKPYIVYGRRSDALLQSLVKDNYPILFEGLHSCYYLSHPLLKKRIKIYRESNIEHHYYFHLSKAEKNLFKKLFFILSGIKLRTFQPVLSHSDLMLTVSMEDQEYLKRRFPRNNIEYLPSFHHHNEVSILPGKGDYALYHGNLSISENIKAAEFLIREVFEMTRNKLIIAGLNPPRRLMELVAKNDNITLTINPSDEEMFSLIRNSQINILITFQATGLKLKLLNALFNGRHCLVNPEMISGTELVNLCEVGSTVEDLREKISRLMKAPFTAEQAALRREHLMKWHSNEKNCGRLIELIRFQSAIGSPQSAVSSRQSSVGGL